MTTKTARTAARGSLVAAGALLMALAPGLPAGADPLAQSVDETILVPGGTPSGFVAVDDQMVEVPGARDLSIRIQATGAAADPVLTGTSGGTECTRMDQTIQLQLGTGASGAVTVSYTQVDGDTGTETPVSESLPLAGGATQPSPTVAICLR